MSRSEERRLKVDVENVITTGPIRSYAPIKNADGNSMCQVCYDACMVNKKYNVFLVYLSQKILKVLNVMSF